MSEIEVPATAPVSAHETGSRSSFGGDLIRMLSGTTMAQVIAVLSTPIITRLFVPYEYGLSVAFASLTSVISVLICLRYEQAVLLPPHDEDAANVVTLSVVAAVLTSALIWVILHIWGLRLFALLNMPELYPLRWSIPLTTVVSGVLLALTQWTIRKRRFRRVSSNTLANSASTTGGRIAAGLTGWNTGGALILANLGGSLFAALLLAQRTWRDDRRLFAASVSPSALSGAMRRYADQPLFGSWSAVLNVLSWQLPIFMLSAWFSPGVAAQYALGNRIFQTPMNIVGVGVSKVLMQRAAETGVGPRMVHLVESTFRRLVAVGLSPILALTIVSPELFSVLFGNEWREAGVYAQLLAFWAFAWYLGSSLGDLYLVHEKNRFFLGWSIVNFITKFASLWIGGRTGNVFLTFILFSATGVAVYGYLVVFLLRTSGVPLQSIFSTLGVGVLTFLPFGLIMLVLVNSSCPVVLTLLLSLGLVAAHVVFLLKDEPIVKDLSERARRIAGSIVSSASGGA